jgi:hypothetical protein
MRYKTWVEVGWSKFNGDRLPYTRLSIETEEQITSKLLSKILKNLCSRRFKLDGFIWLGERAVVTLN